MKNKLINILLIFTLILSLVGCRAMSYDLDDAQDDEQKEKIELTLTSGASVSSELENLINSFNSTNESYYISLGAYDIDADIFAITNNSLGDTTYLNICENLNDYIADENDIIQSLYEAILQDGELNYIPYSFTISTYYVDAKYLDETELLDLETAYNLAVQNNISLFPCNLNSEALLQNLYSYIQDKFVDLETMETHFDSEEFIKFLEYINSHEQNTGESARSLLNAYYISNFAQIYNLKNYENVSEYMFIGIPDEDLGSSEFNIGLRFSMNSNSKYKDGVWEFLSYIMSEEVQAKVLDIPVIQTSLDNIIAYVVENGDSEAGLDASDADKFIQLINDTKSVDDTISEIYYIVIDKCELLFNGNKTVAEVATEIQAQADQSLYSID